MAKQRKPVNNEWMLSYSDMLSLLLCFFILLFAVSSLDAGKWEILVRTINPFLEEPTEIVEIIPNTPGDVLDDTENVLNDLLELLQEFVSENELEEEMEIVGGEGFVFIMFRNNILFDGDSYVLRPEATPILDFLGNVIYLFSPLIDEVRVLGHTNQADPYRPNPIRGDRFLASNRAAEVLVYLEEKNVIDPRRLQSIGFGQHYPVAPYILEEDRMMNRRVEILITEMDGSADIALEDIYAQVRLNLMRPRL